MKYIDYGISIFKKEALRFIPKNEFYNLSDLHKILIKKKELLAYLAKQRPYEIGSFKGLEEFSNYIKNYDYRKSANKDIAGRGGN